jgi:peptidoglycan hydrolase-like protein with peptidoglycan-binding domain
MAPPILPAKPAEYWKDPALKLTRGDADPKMTGKNVPAPPNYIRDLQKDLIAIGYLKIGADDGSYGLGTERAVRRFQRHARRTLRMQNQAKTTGTPWMGADTGVCDASTAKEIRLWIEKKYVLPFGVYKIVGIDGGKLRDDVAPLWQAALAAAKVKGATLLPAGAATSDYYSDTTRNPANGFKSTGGNSKLSMHYTGRAVDLSMEPAGGKHQRWWIAKDPVDGKTYWRIWCKADKQDGSQGEKIAAKSKTYYEFWHNTGEKQIPEGYYVDLTALLSANCFERIPAQDGWDSVAKKQEWWHFYYAEDIQFTFLDEMELVGFKEADLLKWGWTTQDLDKKPG